ncbi:hypothetical protein [Burkholderia ubonensis]|uniref:hypothetical protein n=1 Tax=Burkholderia ubonensis TaxID=101571 RepID=UPI00075B123C|nr:hypothetical protein [Burkholderia ubonensis]KVD15527.1 hypothetical protein WI79_27535 [Burkholderia ubonensis]KVD76025.1 hypothetical protein WI89_07830 [Burkholderia ubonensis]KVL66387.1 hypothetical protein WJ49_31995 [Burkholderia ubonensis]KVL68025.1 hypothetical protein WJ48_13280 [Burkholderia ubonensis]KVL83402.1 hypothetical protein WJ50_23765 [Burkholderia ubonensis]
MVDEPETFHRDCIDAYHGAALKRYIQLRALGHKSIAALTGAFGHEYAYVMNPYAFIDLIETSDTYMNGFRRAVEASTQNLWSDAIAARVLFSIATDETAKRAERIAAAKELNVLFGITVIDEKGNTRRGLSLEDLLKMAPSTNTSQAAAESKVH